MPTPTEVFHRLLAGITGRHWLDIADLYAEDAVVDIPFAIPAPDRVIGRAALRERFAAADRAGLAFAAHNVVVHETADPEVVIAEFDYAGRSAATGQEFRVANVQVLRVRDGRIVSTRDYHNHAALAGLLNTA